MRGWKPPVTPRAKYATGYNNNDDNDNGNEDDDGDDVDDDDDDDNNETYARDKLNQCPRRQVVRTCHSPSRRF